MGRFRPMGVNPRLGERPSTPLDPGFGHVRIVVSGGFDRGQDS